MKNVESTLMGYMRKSTNGGALKMSIDVDALAKADTYESKDGKRYANLIVNLARVQEVINGDRPVIAVNQLHDVPATPEPAAPAAPAAKPKAAKRK